MYQFRSLYVGLKNEDFFLTPGGLISPHSLCLLYFPFENLYFVPLTFDFNLVVPLRPLSLGFHPFFLSFLLIIYLPTITSVLDEDFSVSRYNPGMWVLGTYQ
jgi:hypothetical protein